MALGGRMSAGNLGWAATGVLELQKSQILTKVNNQGKRIRYTWTYSEAREYEKALVRAGVFPGRLTVSPTRSRSHLPLLCCWFAPKLHRQFRLCPRRERRR